MKSNPYPPPHITQPIGHPTPISSAPLLATSTSRSAQTLCSPIPLTLHRFTTHLLLKIDLLFFIVQISTRINIIFLLVRSRRSEASFFQTGVDFVKVLRVREREGGRGGGRERRIILGKTADRACCIGGFTRVRGRGSRVLTTIRMCPCLLPVCAHDHALAFWHFSAIIMPRLH